MPSLPPFDPLQVGAIDNFAFDLTLDIGQAAMQSTQWTAAFSANGTAATDPDPQARVLSQGLATSIPRRQPNGALVNESGFFTTALFGGAPASSAGGKYVVSVLTTLAPPDSRIIGSSGEIASFNPLVSTELTIPIVFDHGGWISFYPEFAGVSSSQAQNWFNQATIYERNDGQGCITDPQEKQALLWMLTAHLASLFATHNGQPVNTLVGRITSVSQGPVSLSTGLSNGEPGSEEWFMQTQYGYSYWVATFWCRTMHYRVQRFPRIYDPLYSGRGLLLSRGY